VDGRITLFYKAGDTYVYLYARSDSFEAYARYILLSQPGREIGERRRSKTTFRWR
jgi:hypothetical protein